MKAVFFRYGAFSRVFFTTTCLIIATAFSSRGDQVDMKNGDHYEGDVIALDSNTLVLKSDVLGTIRLPRNHVATMSLGTKATARPEQIVAPKPPTIVVPSSTPASAPALDLNSLIRQIASDTNVVAQVQSQVLAGAGPEATKKFNDLIGGLSKGTLTVGDLRKEAQSVSAQLRELRGSENDESGAIFDDYLAILDSFLQQTQPAAPAKAPSMKAAPIRTAKPGSAAPAPKPAPKTSEDE